MTGTRNAPDHHEVEPELEPQLEPEVEPEVERRARWYHRALPVTTLVLALVALAALALPGFRHQLALSASHRTDPYVELAFPRPAVGAPIVCATSTGTPRVEFLLTSHLDHAEELDYQVAVGKTRQQGTLSVEPGETTQVTRFLGRSTRPYVVTVRLPSTGQELRAHCPGTAR